jgi:hypothetical protein
MLTIHIHLVLKIKKEVIPPQENTDSSRVVELIAAVYYI